MVLKIKYCPDCIQIINIFNNYSNEDLIRLQFLNN